MTLADAKKKKIDDFVAGMKVNNVMSLEEQVGALREQAAANAKAAKIELVPKMVALEKAVIDAKGKGDVVVVKKTKVA
jgi:hypothetical protein